MIIVRPENIIEQRDLIRHRIVRALQRCSTNSLLDIERVVNSHAADNLAGHIHNPDGATVAAGGGCRKCGEPRPPAEGAAPWKRKPKSDTATGTICVPCRWQEVRPPDGLPTVFPPTVVHDRFRAPISCTDPCVHRLLRRSIPTRSVASGHIVRHSGVVSGFSVVQSAMSPRLVVDVFHTFTSHSS